MSPTVDYINYTPMARQRYDNHTAVTLMGDADRKIPAVKLFVSQLNSARQPVEAADVTGLAESNLVGLVLMGIEFTRVWVQVRSCWCKLDSTPESADSNALVLL